MLIVAEQSERDVRFRGLVAIQQGEAFLGQGFFHGAQAIGTLGVSGGRRMIEAGFVRKIQRRHWALPLARYGNAQSMR